MIKLTLSLIKAQEKVTEGNEKSDRGKDLVRIRQKFNTIWINAPNKPTLHDWI